MVGFELNKELDDKLVKLYRNRKDDNMTIADAFAYMAEEVVLAMGNSYTALRYQKFASLLSSGSNLSPNMNNMITRHIESMINEKERQDMMDDKIVDTTINNSRIINKKSSEMKSNKNIVSYIKDTKQCFIDDNVEITELNKIHGDYYELKARTIKEIKGIGNFYEEIVTIRYIEVLNNKYNKITLG